MTADTLNPSQIAVGADNIGRTFGTRSVLHGVDLSVASGEFVALIGRSGSGKSTLLRVLAGLDPDFTGSVEIAERSAVVFQDARLMPWKRVVDNIRLGIDRRTSRTRALEILAEVGLAHLTDAWPKSLSGGEAQRVALARALVRDPQVLLMDEPFGALDALTRVNMHYLLAVLHARHRPAVVLVTHDVDEAILLADRVAVLTDGHISLDLTIGLGPHRRKSAPEFGALRDRLLRELGLEE